MPCKTFSDGMIYRFISHPLACVLIEGWDKADEVSIVSVSFCGEKETVALPELLPSEKMDFWAQNIRGFLDGKIVRFPYIPLQISSLTPFQRQVLYAARTVRWGSTVSYAQLAQMAGYKTAIRAVASVMSSNPFPLIIPCHRVIRSDGSVGGFMKQTEGGLVDLKKKLLQREINTLL